MFEKFYPIEIDPHLTVEEKLPHMLEWYDEGHELMLQCDLVKQDFALMVQENPTEFRFLYTSHHVLQSFVNNIFDYLGKELQLF